MKPATILWGILFCLALCLSGQTQAGKAQPGKAQSGETQSGKTQPQPGLRGTYYDGTNFERKVGTRIDPTISFNWRGTKPMQGLRSSYYSVRWTGKLLAPVTGRYTFFAKVDDGIRIWVGNKKVMDVWQLNDSKSFTGSVILKAGEYYDLRIDYFNDLLEGEIYVYWRIPDPAKSPTYFSNDTGEPIDAQYFWQSAPPVTLKPVSVPPKAIVIPPKPVAKNPAPVARLVPRPVSPPPVSKPPVVARPVAVTTAVTSTSLPAKPVEPQLTLVKGEPFILRNVLFEQSSYELLPSSSAVLDQLVQALKANRQWQIEVAGHTDNVGDPRLNRALSENRAKVVANYLIRHGIAEDRIETKGFGGSQPIADNTTETERVKNRRVTITRR